MANTKLLEGIKVIDITTTISGPTASMVLRDMGAYVIKVEHPVRGDDTRHFPVIKNGVSSSYTTCNRGKKGIAVDLHTKEGQEIIRELAKTVDVVVENFKPGTMKQWGIDYETLSKINPGIIMASISGFGQSGPLSHLPGYDIIAQAQSGIMGTTGFSDGPPTRVGVLIGDISSGYCCVAGILGAYVNKLRTGLGQHVDISMQDVLISYMDQPIYTWDGRIPARSGNRLPTIAPFDCYETKDERWAIIAAANNKLWAQLCNIMGKPELADDLRFDSNMNRCDHYDALNDEITEWTTQHDLKEVVKLLQAGGLPVSPILNLDEVMELPHVKERKMYVEVEDPVLGKIKISGSPFKFSRTPCVVDTPAPRLGEHTREILTGIGYSEASINQLSQSGVIKVM